ncbi:MFS general substrate transporter [Dichomitus squalens]|uniref:Autophagy-related protein n=1 Tax=Dichomitus squalens TaxID=114155 RepID=A0A4Q9PJJ0_9APHY|nr:MFS general substrate transporter [Dichomitus squalens]TBU54267.1 MFS general substrate transporter [Dichomitus squalens]
MTIDLDTDGSDFPKFDKQKYNRHLRGWFSYAFASEVFVIVSLTLFLPICLEQFARDNGYLLPDKIYPCTPVTTQPVSNQADVDARCVVKVGWLWIDSASFSLYVYSLSVALQALTVISMGGIADHPLHRKKLLLTFAALGSFSAILFLLLPSSSPVWPLVAPLAIFANVGFGASIVALNAYIPTLAQGAQEVVAARADLLRLTHTDPTRPSYESAEDESTGDAHEPLLSGGEDGDKASAEAKAKHDKLLSATTSRISSQGIALGYAAGIVMLLLALIPVRVLKGSTDSLRLAVGLSGLWWALFSLPAAVWLPGASSTPAPGAIALAESEADVTTAHVREEDDWSMSREIVRAWKRLGQMLRWREIARLRNTFIYLAAWFLLSDGFTTITSTALLFAKTTLHMPASSLILIGALTPSAGIAGSLAWPWVQRRMGWSNLKVLVVLVGMASAIPAYGCLGFLDVFRKSSVKFGGLTTPGEMYVLAVYFGSVYGAFQGYARAFYAEFIPPGEEARWYGLFSITDKSSSFVGPLVVGLIADATGNIRYSFFFLVFMIWAAIPILMAVDVERGREDAQQYTAYAT